MMNEETRKLIYNEKVPASLVEEFACKLKALTAVAEKLNSVVRKTQSVSVKLDCVKLMAQVLKKRREAEEDFRNKAQKNVKKGGVSDEEK